MDETKMIFGDKAIEFVHFNTNNDCDNFLNFASQKNMSISHKCCDGNGCGIENIKKEELNVIIKEYLHLNSNNTVRDWRESKSEGTP